MMSVYHYVIIPFHPQYLPRHAPLILQGAGSQGAGSRWGRTPNFSLLWYEMYCTACKVKIVLLDDFLRIFCLLDPYILPFLAYKLCILNQKRGCEKQPGFKAFNCSNYRVTYKGIRVPIMMIEHTIFARSSSILSYQNVRLLSYTSWMCACDGHIY